MGPEGNDGLTVADGSAKSLAGLPAPPRGSRGWPWTTAEGMSPGGARLPRISVVTPSFNQGRFLEATLRSILLQHYPGLEVIVIDGGSTDGSVEVIRKYEPWLTYWHSRRDDGQAAAIRAGFEIATGEILCWLNSDDIYLPNALHRVGEFFARRPGTGIVYGNRAVINRDGAVTGRHLFPRYLTRMHWALEQPLAQECCFWRREVYDRVGGIDPKLFFVMDYDLFFRMWRSARCCKTPEFLGCIREHAETKSARYQDVWCREFREARERFGLRPPGVLARRVFNRLNRAQLVFEVWQSRFNGAYSREWGLPTRATDGEGVPAGTAIPDEGRSD